MVIQNFMFFLGRKWVREKRGTFELSKNSMQIQVVLVIQGKVRKNWYRLKIDNIKDRFYKKI